MQIRQLTAPNKALFTLTQTFRYLNCCCNFFLYSATSSLFRRELREIFQCSISSMNSTSKEGIQTHTTPFSRPRTTSSPPLYTTNIDNVTAERRRLITISSSAGPNKPSETVTLGITSIEPKNGHVVSFKT